MIDAIVDRGRGGVNRAQKMIDALVDRGRGGVNGIVLPATTSWPPKIKIYCFNSSASLNPEHPKSLGLWHYGRHKLQNAPQKGDPSWFN